MIRLFKYLAIPLLIGAAVGGYLYFGKKTVEPYDFVIVQKGNISQEVSVTGRVKPAKNLGFAFEKTGKISQVYVKVGDQVKEGTQLAKLEGADVSAQVAQAEAAIDAATAQTKQAMAGEEAQRAKLAELIRGLRSEERQLAETKLNNSRQSLFDAERALGNVRNKADVDLENLYGDVKNVLNDAYLKAYDAVNRQTDFVAVDTEWLRAIASDALNQFKNDINNLSPDYDSLDYSLVGAKENLLAIQQYLNRLSDAIDTTASGSLVASTLNTYRGNLNTGRTGVNAAMVSIDSQRKVISSQKVINENTIATAETRKDETYRAMVGAEDEFRLKVAGATQEQLIAQIAAVKQAQAAIEAGQAQIAQAQAGFRNVQAQAGKIILESTVSGIVTRVDADPGEIASPNAPMIFVITEVGFKIETQVPEADISKIQVGNKARITLDAYGEDFPIDGEVSSIDPSETMVEGVATYKVTLQFQSENSGIKSGMTANVDIYTAQRDGIIKVPQRAVLAKNGEKTVRVVNAEGVINEVKVTTGLRGSDGNTEILNGLKEGDKVVVFMKGE